MIEVIIISLNLKGALYNIIYSLKKKKPQISTKIQNIYITMTMICLQTVLNIKFL